MARDRFDIVKYLTEGWLFQEANGSWGEIFESVICEAWNSQGTSLGDFSNRFSDPTTIAENIYNSLSSSLSKGVSLSKQGSVEATPEWRDLGRYGEEKPNSTPKTDIITSDSKFRISVKEAGKNGKSGARIMSGGLNESLATIRAAIKGTELEKTVDELFNDLSGEKARARIQGHSGPIAKKFKKNPDAEPSSESESLIKEIEKTKKKLDSVIESIVKNPEYRKAMIREALTGEVKFGPNSPATATHMLLWEANGICKLYTVDEYLNKFGKEYKIYTTYKSSSVKLKGVKTGEYDAWLIVAIA